MIYENLGNYRFDFLSGVKNAPISIHTTGIEKRADASYHCINKKREDCYLFQYTISGSGTVVTSGKKYIVKKGQGFILKMPDNDEYYFDERHNEAPWHFIYIMFKGDGCLGYYNIIKEKFGNILTFNTDSKSILALFEIYRRASFGLITDSFTGERLTFDFLCKLCSDCFNNEKEFSDLVLKAKKIIDTDYATISGIFEVAQMLNITQSHLSRLFSDEIKTSPIEYLTKVRLQKATNLLNEGKFNIQQIAVKCGFANGNYFCKVFRKNMGVSPLEYRQNTEAIFYNSITI